MIKRFINKQFSEFIATKKVS